MKHTIVATAAGTEFDAFLYATIADERDGEPLTVLSALARQDVDPWDEAARLARLPLEAATLSLRKIIGALAPSSAVRPDSGATAARLIALLPHRVTNRPAPTAANQVAGMGMNPLVIRRYVLLYVALAALTLLSHWLSAPPEPPSGAAAPAAAAATVVPRAAGSSTK